MGLLNPGRLGHLARPEERDYEQRGEYVRRGKVGLLQAAVGPMAYAAS